MPVCWEEQLVDLPIPSAGTALLFLGCHDCFDYVSLKPYGPSKCSKKSTLFFDRPNTQIYHDVTPSKFCIWNTKYPV